MSCSSSWSVALTIYETAPVLGVGFQNFSVAYTPERVRETDVGGYDSANKAPHNIVIGTMVELGPFGLLLLAAFLGPLVLKRGWGPEGAVVQAALAALVINALFLDLLNRKQFWLIVGIACGLAYLSREEWLRPVRRVRADRATGSSASPTLSR